MEKNVPGFLRLINKPSILFLILSVVWWCRLLVLALYVFRIASARFGSRTRQSGPFPRRSLAGSLPMEGDEPTQGETGWLPFFSHWSACNVDTFLVVVVATQNILDPRRVGKQNSGFSDEDISDIICVLYPHSDSARLEVQQLARIKSPYVIGRDEADGVEPDYELEDHASRFESNPINHGNYAIILRLSSRVKNPAAGFAFGRNSARCDVVFVNDPLRRVSNIHFRIYVNEYGNVMIEDQSTNGTFVDRNLLTSHQKEPGKEPVVRWVLSSGNIIRIFLHSEMNDLTFRVRIPRRDDKYEEAYQRKVEEYFASHGLQGPVETVTTGPGGHVDLFKTAAQAAPRRLERQLTEQRSPSKRKDTRAVRREWTGSGKYNRIGMIGKGAFAVVYKVTSKYDGRPYAAKELEKRRFIKNGVLDQKVENEMKIMQKVNHVSSNIAFFSVQHPLCPWRANLYSLISCATWRISTGMTGSSSSSWNSCPEAILESTLWMTGPFPRWTQGQWPSSC